VNYFKHTLNENKRQVRDVFRLDITDIPTSYAYVMFNRN
jgi:hypothetical protein